MPKLGLGLGLAVKAGQGFSFPSPWTPESGVTGLASWYDASDVSTVTTDVGGVSLWSNKVADGPDLTQVTSTERPEIGSINGLQSILFNANDATTFTDRLSTSLSPFQLSEFSNLDDFDVFVVGEVNSLPNATGFYPTINSGNMYAVCPHRYGQMIFSTQGPGNQFAAPAGTISAGQKVIAQFANKATAGEQLIYLDGTVVASETATLPFSVRNLLTVHGFNSSTKVTKSVN